MTAFQLGYSHHRIGLEDWEKHSTLRNLEPEFARRLRAFIVASGGRVGVGTGWRDPVSNDREAARRRRVRAAGGHAAPMQTSDRTWHCAGAAADLVFDDAAAHKWAVEHEASFGLFDFSTVNREPWHFQLSDIPHGRHSGATPRPERFDLPGDDHPAPGKVTPPRRPKDAPEFDPVNQKWSLWPLNHRKPSVHRGTHQRDAVRYLQGVIRFRAGHPHLGIDGSFGFQTEHAVCDVQGFFGLVVDGWVGAKTWAVIDSLA